MLQGTGVWWLLNTVGPRLGDRRLRLLACACCRVVLKHCHSGSLRAIEIAERFADGEATPFELANERFGGRFLPGHAAWAVCWSPDQPAIHRVEQAVTWATDRAGRLASPSYGPPTNAADFLKEAFHDIIGPMEGKPAVLEPHVLGWNDGTIAKLAEVIYRDRVWDQMPVLGDALEDAGCADARVLDHCRASVAHSRGCWVVDRALGLS